MKEKTQTKGEREEGRNSSEETNLNLEE